MQSVIRARDDLARYVRQQVEQRYRETQRRSDLEAAGRLLALALYLEALAWDGELARLLDASAPTCVRREFPSTSTRALIEQWANEQPWPLDVFVRLLIDGELRETLDAELAALA